MLTGLWPTEFSTTVSLLTSVATTFGLPELMEEQELAIRAYRQVCGQRGQNVTVTMDISPLDGLVYHSVQIGGMNAQRFGECLVQTRQQLDPDELMFFIYDGAPAHGNAANPGANTQLKMLRLTAHSSTLLNKPSELSKQR